MFLIGFVERREKNSSKPYAKARRTATRSVAADDRGHRGNHYLDTWGPIPQRRDHHLILDHRCIANAINLMDNMDGHRPAGISAIRRRFPGACSFVAGSRCTPRAAGLLGRSREPLAGILGFNFNPASIFYGRLRLALYGYTALLSRFTQQNYGRFRVASLPLSPAVSALLWDPDSSTTQRSSQYTRIVSRTTLCCKQGAPAAPTPRIDS